jgi:hypothetical protein
VFFWCYSRKPHLRCVAPPLPPPQPVPLPRVRLSVWPRRLPPALAPGRFRCLAPPVGPRRLAPPFGPALAAGAWPRPFRWLAPVVGPGGWTRRWAPPARAGRWRDNGAIRYPKHADGRERLPDRSNSAYSRSLSRLCRGELLVTTVAPVQSSAPHLKRNGVPGASPNGTVTTQGRVQ